MSRVSKAEFEKHTQGLSVSSTERWTDKRYCEHYAFGQGRYLIGWVHHYHDKPSEYFLNDRLGHLAQLETIAALLDESNTAMDKLPWRT